VRVRRGWHREFVEELPGRENADAIMAPNNQKVFVACDDHFSA
jgi:hypothetical protein